MLALLAIVPPAWLLSGCATPAAAPVARRHFSLEQDTFAFPNELVWQYERDERGRWLAEKRQPRPDYALRCFVLARSAKQFFQSARFDAAQPPPDADTCRRLVREVAGSSARRPRAAPPITIPGYPDLRSFSQANEALLKAELGGVFQSYFQRGNWRMVFPFTRRQQQATAEALSDEVGRGPVVTHVVCFPRLSINHAILLYDARREPDGIVFSAYDPNDPSAPLPLSYHSATRSFSLPPTKYFPGGKVNVYEVYSRWDR